MGIDMGLMRICASLLLAMLLTGCSPEYNWREVAVSDDVGQVLFPDKPRDETRTLEFVGHEVQFTLTSAQVGEGIFAVGYAPWSAALQADEALRRKMGQTVIASLYQNLGREAPDELPGFGEPFEIESDAGIRLQARVWLSSRGLVEGMVMGPAREFSVDAAEDFFDSLAKGR